MMTQYCFTTCFIRGSNRLAGMDGTLGVAPRHAHDTKSASWFVSQSFAATTLRRLREGPWERRPVSCEKTRAPGKRPDLCVVLKPMVAWGTRSLGKLQFFFLPPSPECGGKMVKSGDINGADQPWWNQEDPRSIRIFFQLFCFLFIDVLF